MLRYKNITGCSMNDYLMRNEFVPMVLDETGSTLDTTGLEAVDPYVLTSDVSDGRPVREHRSCLRRVVCPMSCCMFME